MSGSKNYGTFTQWNYMQQRERRSSYPLGQLSFRMAGQIKDFPDKVKLKEFIITKPLLYEMLKGLI